MGRSSLFAPDLVVGLFTASSPYLAGRPQHRYGAFAPPGRALFLSAIKSAKCRTRAAAHTTTRLSRSEPREGDLEQLRQLVQLVVHRLADSTHKVEHV